VSETAPVSHLPGLAAEPSVTSGLVLDEVSKAFPGVQALSQVSFDVRPGEVHGLVGENGAGKSTLMAIASGSLLPDTGTITINGQPLLDASPQRAREMGLAIVRQSPALMPDLTVADNLFLGVGRSARPSTHRIGPWAEARLESWDKAISIEPGARVASLVPEEKFIVEIGKALAQHPAVLVLDEPTEHLSTEDVQRLFVRIRELRDDGCAIVYISHRIHEVCQISDRVMVLRDGQVKGNLPADEVDESKIVNLIVGRSLDSAFPDKSTASLSAAVVLEIDRLSGSGFNEISLSVQRGEIVGLAGIEGNGQRELMRALAGLNRSRGLVEIAGHEISVSTPGSARKAGIAYVPADRHHEGIVETQSVRENLSMRTLAAHAWGGMVRRTSEEGAARDAVSRFRIKTPSIDSPIASLSGGNQQKVVLASVLASRPRVLLADEPSQGVAVGARMEIYRLIRAEASNGSAVMVVSSDAVELAGLCDRVLIFSRGGVVAEHAGADVTEFNITGSILRSTSQRIRPQRASRLVNFLAGPAAPLISLAVAIVALGLWAGVLNSSYLSGRSLSGLLALASTLAFVTFGQQLVLAAGGIDLSVGPLMGALVVIESFYLLDNARPSTQIVGWLLLFMAAMSVGFVNWGLIYVLRLDPMIATLATFTALQGFSLTLRPTPGGFISGKLIDTITTKVGPVPLMFIAAVMVAVVAEVLLYRSSFGISLRGVGSNVAAARTAGISPRRIHLAAYVGCSLFAALAAIPLIAQVGSGDPSAGSSYTLTGVAAAVIGGASIVGGRGSFVGALLGSLFIVQVHAVTTFLNLDQALSAFLLGGLTIVSVAAYSRSRLLEVPR
jgi:ribose transport system permease protein/ribose transport system ATP-binding protein